MIIQRPECAFALILLLAISLATTSCTDPPVEKNGSESETHSSAGSGSTQNAAKFIGIYEWIHGSEGLGFEAGRMVIQPGGTAQFYVGDVEFPDEEWTAGNQEALYVRSSTGHASVFRANSDGDIIKVATEHNGRRTDLPENMRETYKKLE